MQAVKALTTLGDLDGDVFLWAAEQGDLDGVVGQMGSSCLGGTCGWWCNSCTEGRILDVDDKQINYFTSSDPHHDMLGGGCQVRVVIENMMGRMENLKTLISGFLGLVILVRWALVTMFLS